MAKQTDLERSIMKLAKAAGELQRAANEVKSILGIRGIRRAGHTKLLMCVKCEEKLIGKGPSIEGVRLYRCPKCRGETWVKED